MIRVRRVTLAAVAGALLSGMFPVDAAWAADSAARTPPTGCGVDAKLVPACNILWGAAAGGFTGVPRDVALRQWETASGRAAAIYHTYHQGDELFPTVSEIVMTRDPDRPRTLLVNWTIAHDTRWAAVAAGAADARIDRLSAYIRAAHPGRFFLAVHHEPEKDVVTTAGSGMTAADYAAMFRHVVRRMRANGLSNVVFVVAYMGNEKWLAKPWWPDLYPGDDVVDWIGLDSYLNAVPNAYHYGTFADLLDRGPPGGPGFYQWAMTSHPTKPIMIAEWGVHHRTTTTADKAAIFDTVLPELRRRPAIKALVYFDTPYDNEGDRNIAIDSSPESLAAFRRIAADPIFDVRLGLDATRGHVRSSSAAVVRR